MGKKIKKNFLKKIPWKEKKLGQKEKKKREEEDAI